MAAKQFRLPDLGEGLEDAEVVRWLVAEGDDVALNQPLIEVDTAKALVEIPSPVAGKIQQLHASASEVVKVGAVLVTFEVAGSDEPAESKRTAVLVGYGVEEGTAPKRRRRLSAGSQKIEAAPDAASATSKRVQAAPPVRKLAAELGVDLANVNGSGPGGRITREDVMSASRSVAAEDDGASTLSEGDERVAVRGVRKLVAQKMARSVAEIPHVTTYLSFDAGEVMDLRTELSTTQIKVTPLAVIAKAFVHICGVHRELNSSFDLGRQEIVLKGDVDLGIATDTDRGLLVPVIPAAGSLSMIQIAEQIAALSEGGRSGKLAPEQLTGSTVTISNVGSFGAEYGTPIINHPEASILAVGVIEERAVVRASQIVVRPMCTLSLSFDHRVMDGAEAGRALMDLKLLLEDREKLRQL